MTKLPGYNFYTEPSTTTKGNWVGRCKEIPTISYERPVRDTALSGIRRTVESMVRKGKVPTSVSPSTPSPYQLPQPAAVITLAPVEKTKTKLNRVAFVIDRSGSMRGLEPAVLKALNSNIEQLRELERTTGQVTLVTILEFDTVTKVIRNDVPLATYMPVTYEEIAARGGTALLDATADAINQIGLHLVGADYDVSYLVNVMTDGEENQSRRTTWAMLASLMKQRTGTDMWTFTFLVPPGHSHYITNRLGAFAGNVSEWENTVKGVETYAAANAVGLTNFYASRSAGMRSTTTFYTDTTKATKAQVKANLVDVRADVAVWPVQQASEVRTFCENQGARPYVSGAAFYQLMKPEKVQSYKKLIIVDRVSGAVYAGDAARQLLGVPNTVSTIRLAPGNHSNYDVFVQSTSVNRKLFPGSKVIYYTKAVGGH